jgi:AcrR family transcriptional regulator
MTTVRATDESSAIELRRRRHILRVVAAVVAEEGFSGATMRRIAERAGVSTGMLTYYYQNKRDLLNDMMANTYSGFVHQLNEMTGQDMGPQRIEASFEVMLSGSKTGQFPMSFWLSYFGEAIRDEELRRPSIEGLDRLRRMFYRVAQVGIERGEWRCDLDPAYIADLLIMLWQGIRVEVGLYGMPEDRASEIVIETLRLLRAGSTPMSD